MKGKIVSLLIAILLAIPFIKGQNAQYESSENSEPSLAEDIENFTSSNRSYPKTHGDIIFETWGYYSAFSWQSRPYCIVYREWKNC
ncbi:MAG: hypothetical protein H5T45_04600 [Thermoplasmatales archaeon]|nr:hypothetical protein [Thermoplasmatales archaeon]